MIQKKLLGYYNYTVILTYIGMLIGFTGIIYAFEGNAFTAVICLMVAGCCDMFDGAIATTRSRTPQEKCFGIQIDSFSDLICFGVLPAVIVYCQSRSHDGVLVIAGLYVLCALIRLAYFNVDEQERQQHIHTARTVYYGLPVTLSALFLPLVQATVSLPNWQPATALTLTLLVMAILFLLPFPLRKPKLVGKLAMLLCGVFEVGFVVLSLAGAS